MTVREWYRLGWLLPWLVLVFALVVTFMMWRSEQQNVIDELQIDFDFRVREVEARITDRIMTYEQILRGAEAFFMASNNVTHQEFRTYVEFLHLEDNYPGSHAVGFAPIIAAKQAADNIHTMRAEGFSDYTILPEGKRDFYVPVTYITPPILNNLQSMGYDLFSDPVRRAAMEQSRDTAKAVNTGKVLLPLEVGEQMEVPSGFVMFLPVYKLNNAISTLEGRRANIVGWVFVPFHMTDMMDGILDELSADVDIEIHDGDEVANETMLYDPDGSRAYGNPNAKFRHKNRLEIGGHTWTVVISSLPGFEMRVDAKKPNLIAYVGVTIGLLSTLLAALLVRGRARALQAAEAINRELNDRIVAEERLKHLAHHDVLTDLPNRTLFSDRLKQALAQAKRGRASLALLFLDLDNFKPVNDTYGHAVGDLLLRQVAIRLLKCVRESDTVSRIGGDEFVVLLPSVETGHDAMLVAEKMLLVLSQTFELDGHDLHISGSIGIAVYPEHGSDEITLTHSADTAMYYAKSDGRNRVKLYQPDMRDAG